MSVLSCSGCGDQSGGRGVWRSAASARPRLSLCCDWPSLYRYHWALPSTSPKGKKINRLRWFLCGFMLAGWSCNPLSLHMGALQLALRGTVFARMAPDQKTQLVEALQSIEWAFHLVVDLSFSLLDELWLISQWFHNICNICLIHPICLPSSYIVGMCGDGANDCGVSIDKED